MSARPAAPPAMPQPPRSADRRLARFAPVDLNLVPAVDALLDRLGAGPFVRSELTAPPGRNDVWAGPTAGGHWMFVKRLVGSPEFVRDRLRRLAAFEIARTGIGRDLRAPELLGLDEAAGICVFEYVAGAVPGSELAAEDRFDDELAEATGRAIGAVHAGPTAPLAGLDNSPPHMPAPEFLVGLPVGMVDALTMAELDSWRLLQQDTALRRAIDELLAAEAAAPPVPAHCDLRLDQLLVARGEVHVTDWEDFRLADPARDLGGFAGQWLQRAMLDVVTSRGGSAFADIDLSHDEVVRRGVAHLGRVRSRVVRFWTGYTDRYGEPDPGLAVRATAFAGWHLLDRLLAAAGRTTRVSGIERAAAGVGRAALLQPERFAIALGLGAAA
jgi:hypothetical protein